MSSSRPRASGVDRLSGTKLLVIVVAITTFLCGRDVPLMHAKERSIAQDPRFHATVDMVIVNVAVFDRSGVPVDDLEEADFTIFDDGQEQRIAILLTPFGAPLVIVFALDFSESIRPAAPTAREAATTFLQSLSHDDCVYVLPFQSSVARGEWIPGADPDIGRRLAMIPFVGGTALYDAIEIGLEKLEGVGTETPDSTASPAGETACGTSPGGKARPQGPDRRRAFVVLTDGDDQNSAVEYSDVLSLAQRAGVPIFPVAIGGAADPFWGASNVGRILSNKRHAMQLEELARSSGGMMIRGNGTDGLETAYAEVLNALKASYVIGYYLPTGRAESGEERYAWREIDVTVSRPEVRVQARPGYLARSPDRLVPAKRAARRERG